MNPARLAVCEQESQIHFSGLALFTRNPIRNISLRSPSNELWLSHVVTDCPAVREV
jgi:hypothetical protein